MKTNFRKYSVIAMSTLMAICYASASYAVYNYGEGSPYPKLPNAPEKTLTLKDKNDVKLEPASELVYGKPTDSKPPVDRYSVGGVDYAIYRRVFELPDLKISTGQKDQEGRDIMRSVTKNIKVMLMGVQSSASPSVRWTATIVSTPKNKLGAGDWSGFDGQPLFSPAKFTDPKRGGFWVMEVPVQYRMVMQIDSPSAKINLQDYTFQEPNSPTLRIGTAKKVHQTLANGAVLETQNEATNRQLRQGTTKLSINTYRADASDSVKQIVWNQNLTHFFTAQKSNNLEEFGGGAFLGDPILSGSSVYRTTNGLARFDNLPTSMQQYSPETTVSYTANSVIGTPAASTIYIQLSAVDWTTYAEIFPLFGFKLPGGNVETPSVTAAIEVPGSF